MRLPELLAPAGSREAFKGAVSAGADAVYLGGMKFGARAYAANFSEEEIITSLREAHILGKKIYLTLNILTRESEMEETLAFAERMHRAGLDGVIIQDLGVAAALHKSCPSLPLHASTQMSVTTSDAVRMLKKIGIVRVVPARELSLSEIKEMKREEPVEIETFIHGAMCYAYSGRCLFSSFLGGRSGNRGRCAGTCRLPYDILDEQGKPMMQRAGKGAGKHSFYPLSMRDMNVLSILPDLIDAGIDSFKIEGRMKSPEYAAGVTALYRKYMDRYVSWDKAGRKSPWKVERADQEALRSLYLRTSLSTGYYYRRNGRELLTLDKPGYAGTDAQLLQNIQERYLRGLPKREVCGEVLMRAGEPASLTLWTSPDQRVTVQGEVVQHADRRPLTEEEIGRRMKKTGDSMLRIADLKVDTSGDAFLPVSALNELRRRAVFEMEEKLAGNHAALKSDLADDSADVRADAPAVEITDDTVNIVKERNTADCPADEPGRTGGSSPRIWASVTTAEQLKAALETGVSCVIVEAVPELMRQIGSIRADKTTMFLVLPHIIRSGDRARIRELITQNDKLADGFFVRTLEQLQILRDLGYSGQIAADGFLYQWNLEARDLLLTYANKLMLPWELSAADQRALLAGAADRQLLTVYGRIPMMLSAGCVRKTMNACTHREQGFAQIADRKGVHFPVRCVCSSCYNVIYNSLPLSLHRFAGQNDPLMFEAGGWVCSFTTESGPRTGQILRAFMRAASHQAADPFGEASGTYTTGHFKKSAL